jgi:hypothetical protein
MDPGFSDEEFVGYTFRASPERRPRLWFLDRHLFILIAGCGWTISDKESTWSGDIDIDVGTWTAHIPRDKPLEDLKDGMRLMDLATPGVMIRYDHHSDPPWSAVWRLTNTIIEHVHTFGRDDDVWRLGVWPD